ncbi:hypothetical protein N7U66_13725 [Lacinutrix neustonica]|uniref:Lipoprotein n=1 Tax=Lacinutrix neustonica TaxID=2980107 RepID=A0A9E8MUA9_9FLAO|nr:hypothetical protein [Lacinutrix neustonica]WAC01186.1 hypothetical protein N7U66_13725 [Lacinutrix neustonica]
MKYFIILLVITSLVACKKEGTAATKDFAVEADSTKITIEDLSQLSYVDYGVDEKAKNALDSWQAYATVSSAMGKLRTANFDFFKTDDEEFNTLLKDLKLTIPVSIDSDPVQARVLVLRTKLLKLREAIDLKTIEKKDRLIAVKELFQAFSYVTLQINKKFEKEAQNIIKPDSV